MPPITSKTICSILALAGATARDHYSTLWRSPMYSSRLRVFTQLAFVAVLVFMLAAVPVAFADSQAQSGPVSPDMLLGQAAQPASAAGLGRAMAPAVADIFVDDNYNALTPGWNVTAFNTVQGGVDGAASGNTVLVYPGNYVENVNVDRLSRCRATPAPATLPVQSIFVQPRLRDAGIRIAMPRAYSPQPALAANRCSNTVSVQTRQRTGRQLTAPPL